MTPTPPTSPGLTPAQAAQRLREDGPNELPRGPQRTAWRIALEVVREPMSLLLLAGVGVYLLLGDAREAAVLLAFVTVTIGISVVQQGRSERVVQALREMASPRAVVLRDGQALRIPGREVVLGDLLLLAEGDRVAADGVLLEAADLLVD